MATSDIILSTYRWPIRSMNNHGYVIAIVNDINNLYDYVKP